MSDMTTEWEREDSALLASIAHERDRRAFRALFDRYSLRVDAFIRRRLQDEELSREVTSDVFFEVWSNAATFRGDSSVSTWIFGISRFKCMEANRLRSRLKRSRVVSTTDEVISQVPEPHDAGTHLDARQNLRRVAVMMERLPANQRRALEMIVLDGLSVEEVARRQEISTGTVKTRVSRARRALRGMLGDSVMA